MEMQEYQGIARHICAHELDPSCGCSGCRGFQGGFIELGPVGTFGKVNRETVQAALDHHEIGFGVANPYPDYLIRDDKVYLQKCGLDVSSYLIDRRSNLEIDPDYLDIFLMELLDRHRRASLRGYHVIDCRKRMVIDHVFTHDGHSVAWNGGRSILDVETRIEDSVLEGVVPAKRDVNRGMTTRIDD